jgi:A/G-specific adenine glycosylase
MVCFEAGHVAGTFRSDFYREGRWLAPGQLADYPVSAPQRRLARSLTVPGRQRRLF